jgi:methylated-DNA-[protein]-cysteine S-methyltransferase
MMTSVDSERIARVLRPDPADLGASARRFVQRADDEGLVDVAYASLETPLGVAIVAATRRGLVRLALPNQQREDVLEELATNISPRVLEVPRRLDLVRRELDEYFAGRRRAFDLELDWRLARPGFYRSVLRVAAARLPFGVTASYGEVAAWAGSPRASRAAGTALARNPLPIVIPCHRVLRAGGRLGRYGGGPEMKKRLLRHEGAITN